MLDKRDMLTEDKMYKVVIDTNIWISFLIGKSLQKLLDYILDERIMVYTCSEQIAELTKSLGKPKLKKYFNSQKIAVFFNFLQEYATIVPIVSEIDVCRDKKDNYLLSLAMDTQADFLITGDEDLLVL